MFELGVRAACEDGVGVARVDASMRARGRHVDVDRRRVRTTGVTIGRDGTRRDATGRDGTGRSSSREDGARAMGGNGFCARCGTGLRLTTQASTVSCSGCGKEHSLDEGAKDGRREAREGEDGRESEANARWKTCATRARRRGDARAMMRRRGR